MKHFTLKDCKDQAGLWMRESWLVNLKYFHPNIWMFFLMGGFAVVMILIGLWAMEIPQTIVKGIINELL